MPKNSQWPTNRLLSTAARLVEHAWNERLASLGVTHAGVMALDVLAVNGGLTQARLAQEVRVQAQTMGKTLHRLEIHGHVSRSRNANDRRSHLVVITEEGRRVLTEATRMEQDLIGDGSLSDDQLRRSLAHIVTTLGGARWKLKVDDDGEVREIAADAAPSSQTPVARVDAELPSL
ncbi:MarR family winged helix-turn-helix transcriptional regulator [Kocuria sp.]|uniref:MarR family winged helix-turn-helix transcriptional regulator n=1 Tax=Kocuria sp. TaxID=1871328 RepID=UPI0026DF1635|nr:MarR family transcriptional regulator [Kocuria sp.]MDO5618346.1 MarR family transcriptional regulator [Kocuria sp.]